MLTKIKHTNKSLTDTQIKKVLQTALSVKTPSQRDSLLDWVADIPFGTAPEKTMLLRVANIITSSLIY